MSFYNNPHTKTQQGKIKTVMKTGSRNGGGLHCEGLHVAAEPFTEK
jgi:hypothetical protein